MNDRERRIPFSPLSTLCGTFLIKDGGGGAAIKPSVPGICPVLDITVCIFIYYLLRRWRRWVFSVHVGFCSCGPGLPASLRALLHVWVLGSAVHCTVLSRCGAWAQLPTANGTSAPRPGSDPQPWHRRMILNRWITREVP